MIENFKVIKEIDSLDRDKKQLLDQINTQLLRLSSIKLRISDKEEEQAELISNSKLMAKNLTKLENELSALQQKLENKTAQKGQVFTDLQIKALDKEIVTYSENIIICEDQLFECMESKESIDEKIEDSKNFITGATKSLIDIKNEVDQTNSKLNSKIQILNQRTDNLISTIPEDFKIKVLSLLDKNIKSTILTTIKDRACNYCRTSLATQFISEVEDKHSLKTCVACKRIFIPSASSY